MFMKNSLYKKVFFLSFENFKTIRAESRDIHINYVLTLSQALFFNLIKLKEMKRMKYGT